MAVLSWAIWFWIALYSSFFLTWLSLTLRSSILVCWPWSGCSCFLSWTLASWSALLGGLERRLAVGQGGLPGGEGLRARGQPVAQRLGALVELVEFAEVAAVAGIVRSRLLE